MRTRILILLPFAALIALGDCPDGARNTTPQEQAFYASTIETLAAAVPPAPAGWELKKTPIYKPASSVCKGTDASRVVYSVAYSWTEGLKEQNRRTEEMQKKVADLRKVPEDKAAQINELAQQSRALRAARAKARAEKNVEEAERLDREGKALDLQGAKIRKDHEAAVLPRIMEITQAYLEAEKGKTYQVSMTLAVNETPNGSKPGGGMTKTREGLELSAGAGKPVPNKLQHQNLVVRWSGDAAQVDVVAKAFDKASLQNILRD